MSMKVITVQSACKILGEHGFSVSPAHLGAGLRQRVYPFGVAIKMKDWTYEIYEASLLRWIKERESEEV